MQMRRYTIRFITPAFLGDAEQRGAWRAPPFKALMRQWWRVLAAREHDYDHEKLRREEGTLFGHAWLERTKGKTWAMKSQVLLRLSPWEQGTLQALPTEQKVFHKEVGEGGRSVGANLYLGYGPLSPLSHDKKVKQTSFKASPAIDSQQTAELALGYPDELAQIIGDTMQLLHWFGTVGGRSRNGWGSFTLEGEGIEGFDSLKSSHRLIQKLARPLIECLKKDWPHAIGKDENSVLIWKSKEPSGSWSDVVQALAKAKIEFRTSLPFHGPKGRLEDRHVLAYPVTNHRVNNWGNGRLANQIRFKLLQNEKGYSGLIYHLPCKIPEALTSGFAGSRNDLAANQVKQLGIWQRVHQSLDGNASFERI